jgi:hypothetical protein
LLFASQCWSHEANYINDSTTNAQAVAIVKPRIIRNYNNGHFIWGAHGGYDFVLSNMFMVGVESGYKSLGQSTGWVTSYSYTATSPVSATNYGTSITAYSYINRQQAVDFLLTGRIYVYERLPGLNLLGKAGAAYVRAHDSINFMTSVYTPTPTLSNVSYNLSDYQSPVIWRLEPEVSIGVGYSLLQGIDLNLMYTHIGGTDGNTATNNSVAAYSVPWQAVFAYNALSGGVNYRFG